MSDLLRRGDFIRVKAESHFRSGEDGFVVDAEDNDGSVGLIFLYDRYGQPNITPPYAGIESWDRHELDYTTLDKTTNSLKTI